MYLQQYFKLQHHGKIAFEANNKIYIESQFILAQKYESSCRCNPENDYLLYSNYGIDDNYIQIEKSLKMFINSMTKSCVICTNNFSYIHKDYVISDWKTMVNEDNCIKIHV
jgi:hypothetical protein